MTGVQTCALPIYAWIYGQVGGAENFRSRIDTLLKLNLEEIDRMTNIVDSWKNPVVYYRPISNVAYVVYGNNDIKTYASNFNYAIGGQINIATYDLFSCGADQMTYVPGAVPTWWSNSQYGVDDIGNCKR